MLPSAALREISGSVTVATATPKIPSGNCISRNAMLSQPLAPSSSYEANPLLTSDVHLDGARRDHRRAH